MSMTEIGGPQYSLLDVECHALLPVKSAAPSQRMEALKDITFGSV